MGLMVGGSTLRTITLGNVISDTREPGKKRLMYGLLLRGCRHGVAAYNYVSGCKLTDVKEQAPGAGFLNEKNLP